MSRHCAQCEALKGEIERLKEELSAWQDYAEPTEPECDQAYAQRLATWQSKLGLIPASAAILIALCDAGGRPVSHADLFEATRRAKTRASRVEVQDPSLLVKVRVNYLRHGLSEHWAQARRDIISINSYGYHITPKLAQFCRVAVGEVPA